MCSTEGNMLPMNILDLPDDAIFMILSSFDRQNLGRISRVCRRLRTLSRADHVWLPLKQNMLAVGPTRKIGSGNLSIKDQCRISHHWFNAHWNNVAIGRHRIRQMPCLALLEGRLLSTYNNSIRSYLQAAHKKRSHESPFETFYTHHCDISRLVATEKHVIFGDRLGNLVVRDIRTEENIQYIEKGHDGDVLGLAASSTVIVSGSRDGTVKVWRIDDSMSSTEPLNCITLEDRLCCTAVNSDESKYVIGTAGIKFLPPLQLWDLKRQVLLGHLGEDYRHGAGVMDAEFESPHTLLSCGYDTIVRLWDLRMPYHKCAVSLEDVYDETVYCVRSAGEHAILSGMARHGLVELWDRRSTKQPVQLYFTCSSGLKSSPVYSLALDSTGLYVGLDRSIRMLDFNVSLSH